MIIANFTDGYSTATAHGLYQWDYGQILEIHGLSLPTAVEVHFAMEKSIRDAKIRIGNTVDKVTKVAIPEYILEQSGDAVAYIYISDTTSGKTVKKINMPIIARQKPEAFDAPEDAQLFREAIEAVNAAAEQSENSADMAEQAKNLVMQIGREVTENKEYVDKKIDDFNILHQQAIEDTYNAGNGQIESINAAGQKAIENIGTGIDHTFTQEGKAADAKATGDKLTKLKDDLDELNNRGLLAKENLLSCNTGYKTISEENLFNTDNPLIVDGYIDVNGVTHEDIGTNMSDYVNVLNTDNLYITLKKNTLNKSYVVIGFDINKKFISGTSLSPNISFRNLPRGFHVDVSQYSYISIGYIADESDNVKIFDYDKVILSNDFRKKIYSTLDNYVDYPYDLRKINNNQFHAKGNIIKDNDVSEVEINVENFITMEIKCSNIEDDYIVDFYNNDKFVKSVTLLKGKTSYKIDIPLNATKAYCAFYNYEMCAGYDIKLIKSKSQSIWNNTNAIFLGDSITYGKGTTKTFHDFLDDMIGFSDKKVYGVSGSTISSGDDIDTGFQPFTQRYQNMSDEADIVCVFGGTNDFGWRHIPLGTISDITDTTFYGSLDVLINGLVNKYPTSTIFFVTPLHRAEGDGESEFTPNKHGKILVDYVNAIKEVCEKYSIPVCDLWKLSGIQPNIEIHKQTYTSKTADLAPNADGLHPNELGHLKIAKIIFSFMQNI